MTLTSSPNPISYREIASEGNLKLASNPQRVVVLSSGSNYAGNSVSTIQSQIDSTIVAIRTRMPSASIYMIIPFANMSDYYRGSGTTTIPSTAATAVADRYNITKIIFTSSYDGIHPSDYNAIIAQISMNVSIDPSQWYFVGDSIAYAAATTARSNTSYSENSRTPQYILENFVPLLPIETTQLFPSTTFGASSLENYQWPQLLGQLDVTQISFNDLYTKQNAYTLYDTQQLYFTGGSGSGEKDTVTRGVDLKLLYPKMFNMYDGYRGGGYHKMWFSVDVAAPSSSSISRAVTYDYILAAQIAYRSRYDSVAQAKILNYGLPITNETWKNVFLNNGLDDWHFSGSSLTTLYYGNEVLTVNSSNQPIAPWTVGSPGNYNGPFEVWRCFFPFNPDSAVTTAARTVIPGVEPPTWDNSGAYETVGFVQGVDYLGYSRPNDVGVGIENMSPGVYRTKTGTVTTTVAGNSDLFDYTAAVRYIAGFRDGAAPGLEAYFFIVNSLEQAFGTATPTQEAAKAKLTTPNNFLGYTIDGSNRGQLVRNNSYTLLGTLWPADFSRYTLQIRSDVYLDYYSTATYIAYVYGNLTQGTRSSSFAGTTGIYPDTPGSFKYYQGNQGYVYPNQDFYKAQLTPGGSTFDWYGWRIDPTNLSRLIRIVGASNETLPIFTIDYKTTMKNNGVDNFSFWSTTRSLESLPLKEQQDEIFGALYTVGIFKTSPTNSYESIYPWKYYSNFNVSLSGYLASPFGSNEYNSWVGIVRTRGRGSVELLPAVFGINSPTSSSRTVGIGYYSFRPNFDRNTFNYLVGNKLNVYYNYTDGIVYASTFYEGETGETTNQGKAYILKVQFWPPHSLDATDATGGGTCRSTTNPVDTNNYHILSLGSMENYMNSNPPITRSPIMPSLSTLVNAATTIDTSTTAGLIATNGNPVLYGWVVRNEEYTYYFPGGDNESIDRIREVYYHIIDSAGNYDIVQYERPPGF